MGYKVGSQGCFGSLPRRVGDLTRIGYRPACDLPAIHRSNPRPRHFLCYINSSPLSLLCGAMVEIRHSYIKSGQGILGSMLCWSIKVLNRPGRPLLIHCASYSPKGFPIVAFSFSVTSNIYPKAFKSNIKIIKKIGWNKKNITKSKYIMYFI